MGILQLLFYSNDKFQFSQKLEKLGVRLNVGAEMYIGEYTDIKRADKDFMPFYMGTSILGGGFSGRLMQTVRDNDGLLMVFQLVIRGIFILAGTGQ